MAIQIGEIMIPCRRCHAAPGEDCTVTEREATGPIKMAVGKYREPHKLRVRDAKKMSDLLDW